MQAFIKHLPGGNETGGNRAPLAVYLLLLLWFAQGCASPDTNPAARPWNRPVSEEIDRDVGPRRF